MIPASITTIEMMAEEMATQSSNNDLSMELPLIVCATTSQIIIIIIINATTITGHSINRRIMGDGEDRIIDRR